MKRIIPLLLALLLCLAPCLAEEQTATETRPIILSVSGTEIPVVWENTAAVQALKELLPLTLRTARYGGCEQVAYLGHNLPDSGEQAESYPGDILLYEGKWIILFYGKTPGACTRLGQIPVELTEEEEREIEEQVKALEEAGELETGTEEKTEELVKLKKIGKMREMVGGSVTITLSVGE